MKSAFVKPDVRRSLQLALVTALLFGAGCFQEKNKPASMKRSTGSEEVPAGQIEKVARERGLTNADLLAAAKVFVPTGAKEQYVGLLSTGSSGRIAVFTLPSMRIVKYVGVFTREPWQGFAYDDESKQILAGSAREDQEYAFGDSGIPALSMTGGQYDGGQVFVVDGANGRVAFVDLDDYETKGIVTNPVFRASDGDAAITPDSEYVVQTAAAPEIPGGKWVDPADAGLGKQLRGGVTLWRFVRGDEKEQARFDTKQSFTLELPPYLQGQTKSGKGASAGYLFTLGACKGTGVTLGMSSCSNPDSKGVLHVIAWKDAAAAAAKLTGKGPLILPLDAAAAQKLVHQIELPAGPEAIAVSPDGAIAAITYRFGTKIDLIDLKKAVAAAGSNDDFGVPTAALADVLLGSVEVGGPSVDAAFAGDGYLYATVGAPGRLVRIDTAKRTKIAEHELGYEGGRITIPGADTVQPESGIAIVMNKRPHGRFTSVGPVNGLDANLIDISSPEMISLYDMSVPQANALAAVVHKIGINKTIFRYKLGTDTRTGNMSPFGTLPGNERIERKGKRVQVFGTLIRSHITPEIVEVEQGDIVTFHFTNLEQAQDQTHGFTVDTYDVHGSWEPGKTASVTFVADRAGVFPYYCTEFCSALHLEMEGILLVKPAGYKGPGTDLSSSAGGSPESKAAYEAKMKSIKDTQAVIDSVVKWLQEHDYAKNGQAKAAAEDALEQLSRTKEVQLKIDEAVKTNDWDTALLWAEQYFQYQVKCADAGLRAKKILTEGGAQ